MTDLAARSEALRRLRWQCRRGMLELDVALRGFLDAEYATLDPAEQEAFVVLLGTEDQTLFEWLMGRSAPEDPAMRNLVERLRRFRPPAD